MSREKDIKFIKKISNFSLDKLLKDNKISKSSFYKGILSDVEIKKIKYKIMEYILNE